MPHNMHPNSSNKFISTGLKTLNVAVISALMLISNADAAGLGKLTVLSSLGQPLRAEIELTSVTPDEAGALVAKLANHESYQRANIEFNPVLMSLQFSIEQRNGRRFVRVTSTQPVNEPFVDMLMELGGTSSQLLREYTVLLDPAGHRSAQPAQIAAPARAAAATAAPSVDRSAPASTAERSTMSAATRAAAAKAVASNTAGATKPMSDEEKMALKASQQADADFKAAQAQKTSQPAGADYHVKKGDTLERIASENLPAGVSLDQMLVALYRNNQNAFAGKNMNRLRSGQILSIPGADAVRNVTPSEAKKVVLAQARDFKSYRNNLAGQVAAAEPNQASESKQSGGGKITAKVEEQSTPASESKDKLKLSRGAGAGAAGGAANTAATEEKIAREKAAAEAAARVKVLEKNVSDLQKTLEVKNKNLAELQNQASNVKPATPDAAAKAPAATPAPSAPTAQAAPAPAPVPAATPVATPAAAAVADVAAAAPAVAAASTPDASAAAEPAPAPAPAPAVAAAPAVTPAPAPEAKPAVVTPPAAEPGFLASVTDNPFLLPIGGVLAAILAGLGIYRYRRNKKLQQAFMDSSGVPTSTGLKGNSLFGSTGGQSVDTKNSIFNSNFVPSVSHLDTNVDPVAEADVYIAYGRDAQAEEILKEALRSQPQRNAIRVKLLEIYANRKDPRSFEILASELYSLTGGEGDDWQQAAALGVTVDPANPLYGSGKLQDQVIAKANAITAPTQTMDGLDFNSLTAPTQPQAAPVVVEKAAEPVQLLAPLTGGELGQQAKAAADQAHANDMDFDLEVLGSEASANQDTVLLSPSHDAARSMMDALDFELEKKAPAAAVAAASAAPAKAVAQSAPAIEPLDLGGIEFPPAGGQPSKYEPSVAHIDIPADVKPVVNAPAPTSHVQEAAVTATPLEFSLPDMSLDLDSAVPGHAAAPVAASVSHVAAEVATPAATGNPEMATKLDLAVAYKEIGDKEGARELLEEVLKGGSAEQVDAAKTLLAKL
ncbi:FimV/HubP family polar landmark protein [Paraherbaspirillum soli]|uniref:FimV/HubP family polar landmark protein n=1 Tax=Paraherbaspirillum soli TaxID=631222 RepID=A0ABW0MD71_9BURK